MQAIGARPRDCRDHPAGGPPEFRGGHERVDLEFQDSVHPQVGSGRPSRGAVGMIVDAGSIQHEAVSIAPASVDAKSRPLAKVERGAALTRTHRYDAWLKQSELVITSAVQ